MNTRIFAFTLTAVLAASAAAEAGPREFQMHVTVHNVSDRCVIAELQYAADRKFRSVFENVPRSASATLTAATTEMHAATIMAQFHVSSDCLSPKTRIIVARRVTVDTHENVYAIGSGGSYVMRDKP